MRARILAPLLALLILAAPAFASRVPPMSGMFDQTGEPLRGSRLPPSGPVYAEYFVGETALRGGVTLSRSTAANSFDAGGNLVSVGPNVPRLAYDPVSLAPLGLLTEAQSTNAVRNSTMQGAFVNSIGLFPTSWGGVYSSGNLNTTLVGLGTINGLNYIDIRIVGTVNQTYYVFALEQAGQIPAAPGQVWSGSLFAALVGGSLTNVAAINTELRPYPVGGASEVPMILGPTLRRQPINTFTLSSNAGSLIIGILINFPAPGVAVDLTLRLAAPQMEMRASPSSPISTYGSAVTRAADVPGFSARVAAYAAAGPSMLEYQDATTGAIKRAAYPAGSFVWPQNAYLRSLAVWPAGTPLGYVQAQQSALGQPYR